MSADEASVRATILGFLERIEKPVTELSAETPLYGDGLELDSLEAAELSAVLEDEFGADPFSQADTDPDTVGDLLRFYGASTGT